jgi:hypothetical protein
MERCRYFRRRYCSGTAGNMDRGSEPLEEAAEIGVRKGSGMDYGRFILRDPQVCGGEPVIAGTRVTIRTILASLAEGASIEEILRDFPASGLGGSTSVRLRRKTSKAGSIFRYLRRSERPALRCQTLNATSISAQDLFHRRFCVRRIKEIRLPATIDLIWKVEKEKQVTGSEPRRYLSELEERDLISYGSFLKVPLPPPQPPPHRQLPG